MLISTVLSISGDYLKNFQERDIEMEMDPEVNRCMFNLYMLLLTGSFHPEYETLLEEFCKEFKKLSKEKQEYIKMDYLRILREQEKNREEGEKKL